MVYGVCFYPEKQKDAQLKLVLQNIIKVGPTRYGTVPNNDAQDGKIKSYFRILEINLSIENIKMLMKMIMMRMIMMMMTMGSSQ